MEKADGENNAVFNRHSGKVQRKAWKPKAIQVELFISTKMCWEASQGDHNKINYYVQDCKELDARKTLINVTRYSTVSVKAWNICFRSKLFLGYSILKLVYFFQTRSICFNLQM